MSIRLPGTLPRLVILANSLSSISTRSFASGSLGSPLLPLKVTKAKHNGTATGGLQPETVDCSTVTPACLQGLYGLPTAAATQTSNQIGVAG